MLSAAQTQVVTSCLIMMRSFHPFCRCKPAPESPCDSLAHVHLLTAPEEGGCPASTPRTLFIHSLASSPLTPLAPQHLPRPSHGSQPWQLLLLSTVLSFTKPHTYFGFQKARAPGTHGVQRGSCQHPAAQHKASSDVPCPHSLCPSQLMAAAIS